MGGSNPNPPPPPPPPPPPSPAPSRVDTSGQQEVARKQQKRRRGRSSTVMTRGQGSAMGGATASSYGTKDTLG